MSMCPECGAWNTKTVATRKDTRYNWIWRRKRCDNCGRQFETYEIFANDIDLPDRWANPDGRLKK